ncbi:MAG: DUF1569 domain-containing protein [Gemmatimonadota bacterium]
MATPRSLRDPAGRSAILDRLARLTPAHERRWGKMEPAQLLPHLGEGLRMALGERRMEGPIKRGLGALIFRYLAIHRFPWPEGKIPAPRGTFKTPSAGWEQDRKLLIELIERFAAAEPGLFAVEHPSFGRMRPKDWDVLQYRHLDHHFRQFGA